MGKPAPLTSDEKIYLASFIRNVVAAVEDDEEQPKPMYLGPGMPSPMPEDVMIFKLSQFAIELEESWSEMNQRLIAAENRHG